MTDRDQYAPSPVPSDSDLWPGEQPFTAFGQFGDDHMDLRVFDQDVYWVDRHGIPHLIAEMDRGYVTGVIDFLLLHAEYFHSCASLSIAVTAFTDALVGKTSGDALAAQLGIPVVTDLTPEQWLESTPLMRTLRARAATDSPPEI